MPAFGYFSLGRILIEQIAYLVHIRVSHNLAVWYRHLVNMLFFIANKDAFS